MREIEDWVALTKEHLKNSSVKSETEAGQSKRFSHITREHLEYMLKEIPLQVERGEVAKSMRWVGYIQGVLACHGVELYKLKQANMRPETCKKGE
jgi:hypothetical protein